MQLLILSFMIMLITMNLNAAEPLKKEQSWLTPEMITDWKNAPDLLKNILYKDTAHYSGASGYRPAYVWKKLDNQWLWDLLPSSNIGRVITIGKTDYYQPNKLGCPIHGANVYKLGGYASVAPFQVDPFKYPGKIRCPVGGELYPSEKFPDDGSGCEYQSKKYYFMGIYSHHIYCAWVVPAIRSLARAYTLTGDEEYGRKAAILLLKVAYELPNGNDRKDRTLVPGYGERSGLYTDHIWEALCLNTYAEAYDEIFPVIIKDTELLNFAQRVMPELRNNKDIAAYIEKYVLLSGLKAIIDFRVVANSGWTEEAVAKIALVLERLPENSQPSFTDVMEFLYYGKGRMISLGNLFTVDGGSYESTFYNKSREGYYRAGQYLRKLKKNYTGKFDESRYPDILADEKISKIPDYNASMKMVGRYDIVIGDTGMAQNINRAVLERKFPKRNSEFLDGWGLGVFRNDNDEFSSALFYGGLRAHASYQPLTLALYAYGCSLLPDAGYPDTWGEAKLWEWSMLPHNTAVVDRCTIPASNTIGSLMQFDAVSEEVKIMEASQRPYRKDQVRGRDNPDVHDYRRLVMQIKLSDNDGYILDIFRITGGKEHWKSYYMYPGLRTDSLKLISKPGTLAGDNIAYNSKPDPAALVEKICVSKINKTEKLTWKNNRADNKTVYIDFHIMPESNSEIIVGEGRHPMSKKITTQLIHARNGNAPLKSRMISVLEPYLDKAGIISIKLLPTESDTGVAVEVIHNLGKDIILSGDSDNSVVKSGSYELHGRSGFIREINTKIFLKLSSGTFLKANNETISANNPQSGKIIALDRQSGQITVEGLNSIDGLTGKRMIINNNGQRLTSWIIKDVSKNNDGNAVLMLNSKGVLAVGEATGFKDGVVKNEKPYICMDYAGLNKIGNQYDYSDTCFWGGSLEASDSNQSFKVRGVEGIPFQIFGGMPGGIGHVHLVDNVPVSTLEKMFEKRNTFKIYAWAVGDEILIPEAIEKIIYKESK